MKTWIHLLRLWLGMLLISGCTKTIERSDINVDLLGSWSSDAAGCDDIKHKEEIELSRGVYTLNYFNDSCKITRSGSWSSIGSNLIFSQATSNCEPAGCSIRDLRCVGEGFGDQLTFQFSLSADHKRLELTSKCKVSFLKR